MERIFDELDRSAIPNENVSEKLMTGTCIEYDLRRDKGDQMRL